MTDQKDERIAEQWRTRANEAELELSKIKESIRYAETCTNKTLSELNDQLTARIAALERERDEARECVSILHAIITPGHIHTLLKHEIDCAADAARKLIAERDELQKQLEECRCDLGEQEFKFDIIRQRLEAELSEEKRGRESARQTFMDDLLVMRKYADAREAERDEVLAENAALRAALDEAKKEIALLVGEINHLRKDKESL